MRAGKEDISRLWFLAGVSTDKNVRCPRMQPLCWVGEGVGTGMGLLKDRRYTYGTEHPRINQMILEKQGALGPDCVAIFRGKIQFHGKAQGQSSYAPYQRPWGPSLLPQQCVWQCTAPPFAGLSQSRPYSDVQVVYLEKQRMSIWS